MANDSDDAPSIPRISVIIPAFNDQIGINRCLEALFSQTFSAGSIEIIVVDNGSTPPIVIEQRFTHTTRLIVCSKPGSYAARNAGAKAAQGIVLAFTDADCTPFKDWLATGYSRLIALGGNFFVGGDVIIPPPSIRSGTALYQYITGFQQQKNIEDKGFSATANLFCTKNQFLRVGPFNEDLLSGGDREWAWRAARNGLSLAYEPRSRVCTAPRATISAAIRQTRRVAAGRKSLSAIPRPKIFSSGLAPHRSPMQAIFWICQRSDLSVWEKLKVISTAIILKLITWLEYARLFLGGKPERR